MLVNGQSVNNVNNQNVLQQLLNPLPGFKVHFIELTPKLPKKQQDLYDQAVGIVKTSSRFDQATYQKGLNKFNEAEEAAGELGKRVQNHNFYLSRADVNKKLGNLDAAKKDLATAQEISTQNYGFIKTEESSILLAELHKETGTLSQFKDEMINKANRSDINNLDKSNKNKFIALLSLGAIAKLEGKHEEAYKAYSKAFLMRQGTIDYDAHRVEQREVGYSTSEKLGTDNLQQCVAVIIRDPETCRTALAHIDVSTDVNDLSNVIDTFGKKPLNVMIVGGRQYEDNKSKSNVNKVIAKLQEHDVNILSADILNKTQSSAIVFDPVSGNLEHRVPGKEHQETFSARKVRYLDNDNTQLHNAFELTDNSSRFNPVKFTEDQQFNIVKRALDSLHGKEIKKDVSHAWHANDVIGDIEVAKQIRRDSPDVFNEELKEHINERCSDIPKKSVKKIETRILNMSNEQGNKLSDLTNGIDTLITADKIGRENSLRNKLSNKLKSLIPSKNKSAKASARGR